MATFLIPCSRPSFVSPTGFDRGRLYSRAFVRVCRPLPGQTASSEVSRAIECRFMSWKAVVDTVLFGSQDFGRVIETFFFKTGLESANGSQPEDREENSGLDRVHLFNYHIPPLFTAEDADSDDDDSVVRSDSSPEDEHEENPGERGTLFSEMERACGVWKEENGQSFAVFNSVFAVLFPILCYSELASTSEFSPFIRSLFVQSIVRYPGACRNGSQDLLRRYVGWFVKAFHVESFELELVSALDTICSHIYRVFDRLHSVLSSISDLIVANRMGLVCEWGFFLEREYRYLIADAIIDIAHADMVSCADGVKFPDASTDLIRFEPSLDEMPRVGGSVWERVVANAQGGICWGCSLDAENWESIAVPLSCDGLARIRGSLAGDVELGVEPESSFLFIYAIQAFSSSMFLSHILKNPKNVHCIVVPSSSFEIFVSRVRSLGVRIVVAQFDRNYARDAFFSRLCEGEGVHALISGLADSAVSFVNCSREDMRKDMSWRWVVDSGFSASVTEEFPGVCVRDCVGIVDGFERIAKCSESELEPLRMVEFALSTFMDVGMICFLRECGALAADDITSVSASFALIRLLSRSLDWQTIPWCYVSEGRICLSDSIAVDVRLPFMSFTVYKPVTFGSDFFLSRLPVIVELFQKEYFLLENDGLEPSLRREWLCRSFIPRMLSSMLSWPIGLSSGSMNPSVSTTKTSPCKDVLFCSSDYGLACAIDGTMGVTLIQNGADIQSILERSQSFTLIESDELLFCPQMLLWLRTPANRLTVLVREHRVSSLEAVISRIGVKTVAVTSYGWCASDLREFLGKKEDNRVF